jgi:hypothetical protein
MCGILLQTLPNAKNHSGYWIGFNVVSSIWHVINHTDWHLFKFQNQGWDVRIILRPQRHQHTAIKHRSRQLPVAGIACGFTIYPHSQIQHQLKDSAYRNACQRSKTFLHCYVKLGDPMLIYQHYTLFWILLLR